MSRYLGIRDEHDDDLEDKSWKRKSYALAQNNALPIPMPHPAYPPPTVCPPPATIRPKYRPQNQRYRPNYNPRFRPPPSDHLPSLSETTPEPTRPAPPPPRQQNLHSPQQHQELSTFKPQHVPSTVPRQSNIPVPVPRGCEQLRPPVREYQEPAVPIPGHQMHVPETQRPYQELSGPIARTQTQYPSADQFSETQRPYQELSGPQERPPSHTVPSDRFQVSGSGFGDSIPPSTYPYQVPPAPKNHMQSFLPPGDPRVSDATYASTNHVAPPPDNINPLPREPVIPPLPNQEIQSYNPPDQPPLIPPLPNAKSTPQFSTFAHPLPPSPPPPPYHPEPTFTSFHTPQNAQTSRDTSQTSLNQPTQPKSPEHQTPPHPESEGTTENRTRVTQKKGPVAPRPRVAPPAVPTQQETTDLSASRPKPLPRHCDTLDTHTKPLSQTQTSTTSALLDSSKPDATPNKSTEVNPATKLHSGLESPSTSPDSIQGETKLVDSNEITGRNASNESLNQSKESQNLLNKENEDYDNQTLNTDSEYIGSSNIPETIESPNLSSSMGLKLDPRTSFEDVREPPAPTQPDPKQNLHSSPQDIKPNQEYNNKNQILVPTTNTEPPGQQNLPLSTSTTEQQHQQDLITCGAKIQPEPLSPHDISTSKPEPQDPRIIDTKTEPPLQNLPLTPTSQSLSSSQGSLSTPRTPPSIRAAPSWQPLFPATPLTRRTTPMPRRSTSTSEASLASTPPLEPSPMPNEECQATGYDNSAMPTPPSSPTQICKDVNAHSHLKDQNEEEKRNDDEEEEEEEIKTDLRVNLNQAYSSSDKALESHSSLNSVCDKALGHSNQALTASDKSLVVKSSLTSIDEKASGKRNEDLNSDKALGHTNKALELSASLSSVEQQTLGEEKVGERKSETYHTYKARFWILTVFSFICFLQTIVWGTFGPIAESAQAAFPTWDDSTIAAFPNWGPIIVVVFIFPMVWLSHKLGLQAAMIICELFLTLGTMIRCFTSQELVFTVMCHVSSVLFAFAACFTLSLPAMIASTWFPPNERITATAVGTLMCQLGGAAMYLGALMVRYPSTDDGTKLTDMEREDIRGDIMVLMYIHFGGAILLLIAVAIYFPAKPPTPPSPSSTEERTDYFTAIRKMFKNIQMILVLVVFAFSFGVPVVWIAVLNLSLKDIGIHQGEAIGVAVTGVVCSSVTAFIAARITDRVYGHLKVTVIALLAVSSLFFLWFLLLTTQVITPSLGQVYAAVAGGLSFEYATVPLLVELAVEIGFPIPENVTGATLTFVFNLVSLVFLGLFQIPNEGHLWVSCVLLACVSLSIVPLVFVKETHKRSDTDRKLM